MSETRYMNPVAQQVHRDSPWAITETGPVNVGPIERWACGVGGGILMVQGLKQRGIGGMALAALGGMLAYRGATGHCALYQTLGVNTAHDEQGPASSVPARQGVKVVQSVIISRPAAELYQFWRRLENLPHVMRHLKSVTSTGANRSHWVAEGPLGLSAEWDAEVYNDRENALIAWRSLEGSQVETAGSVHFVPAAGNRATEVHVSLKYNPPAGQAGIAIARLFGKSAGQQVREDLRRFKHTMEAGELPSASGQSACRTT